MCTLFNFLYSHPKNNFTDNSHYISGYKLVNEGIGSLFRRKDGKYFIYLPKALVEDTAFPFTLESLVKVKVSFNPGEKRLVIEG